MLKGCNIFKKYICKDNRGKIKAGTTALVLSLFMMLQTLPSIASANSLNFSGGYSSSKNMQTGYLVSLDPSNNQTVVPASVNNVNNLVGVITSKNSSNISFNSPGSTIEVGTSGVYNVDVSTINGNISKGDKITASIIEGVGMKAINATRIVGVAIQPFNSNSLGAIKETITGQKNNIIYAGQIQINISVSDYSGLPGSTNTNSLLKPFQNFFAKLVNKNVDQNQTLIAMVLILVCVAVAFSMIIVSTVVSIRSIGRNPLARKGITKHTILIIITVTVILLVSFAAAYFVLVG